MIARASRLLLAAALCPVLAAAQDAAPAERPSAPTVCDCVKDDRCWKLAKAAFGEMFNAEKREVDGAMRGRFFPGAMTWALKDVDKHGHFLRVECGEKRKPCPSNRNVLERRLMATTFLSSMPLKGALSGYFNPDTWEVKPAGIAVFKEALQCRPTYWEEIQTLAGVRVDQ